MSLINNKKVFFLRIFHLQVVGFVRINYQKTLDIAIDRMRLIIIKCFTKMFFQIYSLYIYNKTIEIETF